MGSRRNNQAYLEKKRKKSSLQQSNYNIIPQTLEKSKCQSCGPHRVYTQGAGSQISEPQPLGPSRTASPSALPFQYLCKQILCKNHLPCFYFLTGLWLRHQPQSLPFWFLCSGCFCHPYTSTYSPFKCFLLPQEGSLTSLHWAGAPVTVINCLCFLGRSKQPEF